ncbi:MAG: helix-turn-helix domain-containing protein [Halobacteriales archaeon]
MPHAKLHIGLPSDIWIEEISTAFPETTFRVLAALPADETGVGLLEVIAEEPMTVLERIADAEGIQSLSQLGASDGRAVIQFETTEPLLLFSVRESGIALEPPIEIRDGTATIEVTAPQDRLSALGTQLQEFGMRFDVEYIHREVESANLLTHRQRELVLAAVEAGYYDTPRSCSLTELAEELDSAKSTVSETLHRAEEKIIKDFVASLPGAPNVAPELQ